MKRSLKNIKVFSFIAAALFLASACSKYVDKNPPDQFSDLDFWNSENNVKSFSWGFYHDMITGYGNGLGLGDFYFSSFNDDQDNPTFEDFPKNAPASDGTWDFGDIRKANLMIARVPIVPMDEAAKNHWEGVARFFRAWRYFRLVRRFGDVPWYSQVLEISEDSAIYKPRDPRNKVMDSVLADLDFAVANLRSRADADPNTVNRDVALALKSRVCLFEGTYSEYNENDDARAAKYLQECKDASAELMKAGYGLSGHYKDVYSSNSLEGNPEVILYKNYEDGVLMHSTVGYTNGTTPMRGLTKSAVESYVCSDGLPISLSPRYKGDDNIENLRANRDGRLLETIDFFYCYLGKLVGGMRSSTGYRPAKFLPGLPQSGDTIKPGDTETIPYNISDAPIFWLPEILEDYAEASAELDKLGKYTMTNQDLDISVNLLRDRDDVAPLQLSGHQGTAVNGVPFTDPAKDEDVTSLIWEIRRDRRVELMMDGFRLADLIRWHKLDYMDSQKNPDAFLGAKVPDNAEVTINDEGYIVVYPSSSKRTVQPRNYLWPIPTGEISLYPNGALKQNPGWE
ncbi:RagB/SusD family nutrient uptake outer membrane protein [Compostibacter hankyongensis]|uniref:RagB/SusD family nutrient uptake outer membrane protein n=1 Tax=Compostibacter hankyongensis TaxID=1007089 RepID=A0ABP8FQR6_9BACT